ncbi:MAG: hypothetical protein J1F63_09270 [Oscillospiraceae bacterium]|nr:hypothetical protein [Oscillospiraceae bacterium]
MKLLITGSRSISDFDLTPYIPEGVDLILSGGAKGVDTLAEKYADANEISKVILKGKKELRLIAVCDEALIIWDGKSGGTESVLRELITAEKPYSIVHI